MCFLAVGHTSTSMAHYLDRTVPIHWICCRTSLILQFEWILQQFLGTVRLKLAIQGRKLNRQVGRIEGVVETLEETSRDEPSIESLDDSSKRSKLSLEISRIRNMNIFGLKPSSSNSNQVQKLMILVGLSNLNRLIRSINDLQEADMKVLHVISDV